MNRLSEETGCHVRMDASEAEQESWGLNPASVEIDDLYFMLPWYVTASHEFPELVRVNLQELKQIRWEVLEMCRKSTLPERRVNASD